MKFYETEKGVVVHSNEAFFKALRYAVICIAFIIIAVLFSHELTSIGILCLILLSLLVVTMLLVRVIIQIDSINNRYRQGFMLFGRITGRWVVVNRISYISIFPTLGSKNRSLPLLGVVMIGDIRMKELRINLIVNDRKRIMLQSNMKLLESRKAALELAELLQIGAYDCTGAENVWLKE
ncbi:MAG: hypothetical protein QMC70_09710 [Bacteroidia bacterium]